MWRLLFLPTVVLCACAHTPRGATENVCAERQGLAVLCIYQNDQPAQHEAQLSIGDKQLGSLENDHYLEVVLAPGDHRLAAGLRLRVDPSVQDVTLAAGTVTYFNVEMVPLFGGIWAPTLREQTAQKALAAIAEDCVAMGPAKNLAPNPP